ncbi:hypothetical protein TIFTF001_010069 [Ficus carica]|uniref:Uncharacterized protein n=1 Tax=Ficus carica TaxID=3494 RepID=A0AA88DHL8_FICCA|nr:hypothetical protein TIFTF001_010069 [Ficus carica]
MASSSLSPSASKFQSGDLALASPSHFGDPIPNPIAQTKPNPPLPLLRRPSSFPSHFATRPDPPAPSVQPPTPTTRVAVPRCRPTCL